MPIYEYKCEKCGTVFEKRQRYSDALLTTHPDCGGHVHRLLSAPAFQLKGTGWYATDYAKGATTSPPAHTANGDSAKSEGSSKSESGSKTESGSKSESGSKTESTATSTSKE